MIRFVIALLFLAACTSELQFSDEPSATYHTNITSVMTLRLDGQEAIATVSTRATSAYTQDRYEQLSEYTRIIGNETGVDIRGYYRDDERALVNIDGSWSAYEPNTTLEADLEGMREPLVVLEEHLETNLGGVIEQDETSTTYRIENAHELFTLGLGEGEPTVMITKAHVTIRDGYPSSVSIEADVVSEDESTEARITIERVFEKIGTTTIEPINT